jgi:Fibronectin type III domain
MMVFAGQVEVIMKQKNFKLGFRNASAEKQLKICDTHLGRFANLTADAQADMDLAGLQTIVATAHASRQRIQMLRAELKHTIAIHRTHLRAAREAVSRACLHTLVQTNGNPAAMTAAGLTVRKDWQKVGVPAAPQNLTAAATAFAGEILLRWQRPLRRCFFRMEFTTNPKDENSWRPLGGERAQSFRAKELTPGKLYWFRVRAENIHGASPWSGLASARPA